MLFMWGVASCKMQVFVCSHYLWVIVYSMNSSFFVTCETILQTVIYQRRIIHFKCVKCLNILKFKYFFHEKWIYSTFHKIIYQDQHIAIQIINFSGSAPKQCYTNFEMNLFEFYSVIKNSIQLPLSN